MACVYVCMCVLVAVRFVQRDERKYYEALLQYSREHFVVGMYYTVGLSHVYHWSVVEIDLGKLALSK